jgi:hypothetical protein
MDLLSPHQERRKEEPMPRRATQEDARLVVELAKVAFQPEMLKAFDWVFTEPVPQDYGEFTAASPPGTEKHGHFLALAGFHETVGTLWKHGLINEDLLFDWLGVSLVWDRIKELAVGQREQLKTPAIWENFEAMAEAQARGGTRPSRPRRPTGRATTRKPATARRRRRT